MFAWNEGTYAQASTVVMIVCLIVLVLSLAHWGAPRLVNVVMSALMRMLPEKAEEETA